MKHFSLFILIFLTTTIPLFSQGPEKPIEIRRSFFLTSYVQDGERLPRQEVREMIRVNEQAKEELSRARNNLWFGLAVGAAGSYVVGRQLSREFGNGSANWTYTGFGAGLMVVSFSFTDMYFRKNRNAVRIYNASLKKETSIPASLEVGFSENGIGFCLRF